MSPVVLVVIAIGTIAVAEPVRDGLTLGGSLRAGSFETHTTQDDTPDTTGIGGTVWVGSCYSQRTTFTVELSFVTGRDRHVEEPFGEGVHDYRVYWAEIAGAYNHYFGSRVKLGLRFAFGHLWYRERGTEFPDEDGQDFAGAGFGARVGVDVYQTRSGALSLVVDGEALAAGNDELPFSGVWLATAGLAFDGF